MSFAHAPTVPRQPRPRTHSQFAVPKQTKPHGNPKKKKHADDGDNAHFFAAHHKTEAASPEKQDQATSSPEKNQTTSSPEKPSSSSPEPPASEKPSSAPDRGAAPPDAPPPPPPLARAERAKAELAVARAESVAAELAGAHAARLSLEAELAGARLALSDAEADADDERDGEDLVDVREALVRRALGEELEELALVRAPEHDEDLVEALLVHAGVALHLHPALVHAPHVLHLQLRDGLGVGQDLVAEAVADRAHVGAHGGAGTPPATSTPRPPRPAARPRRGWLPRSPIGF